MQALAEINSSGGGYNIEWFLEAELLYDMAATYEGGSKMQRDARKIALGFYCPSPFDTHRLVGHVMESADPRVVHRQYEGRWFCDACHSRLGNSVRETQNLLSPDVQMHRCAKGCDFDLCGPCTERYCLSPGDWVQRGLDDWVQVTSLAADARSMTIGASNDSWVLRSISPGVLTKVPIGTTCILKQDNCGKIRLVDNSADLAEKDRQLDRSRGNRLDGLGAVQLNELASQVSVALARIHSQQETLRQQVDDCVICVAEPKAVAFQCGHHCCCESCAEGIQKCPMCKARITERLRIFS